MCIKKQYISLCTRILSCVVIVVSLICICSCRKKIIIKRKASTEYIKEKPLDGGCKKKKKEVEKVNYESNKEWTCGLPTMLGGGSRIISVFVILPHSFSTEPK